ncbi:adenylate/guanylate cyclase domain-containing protein, partial [Methylobacterium sp. WL18]
HALRGRGAPLSVATLERGDEAGTAVTEEPAPRKVAAIR